MAGYGITEIDGDLFGAPNSMSLAHCVTADMEMSAGIAVRFRSKYGHVDELLEQQKQAGEVAVLENEDRFIYYLVTKESSLQKATYETLRASLKAMRDHMKINGVTKLAIPKIGTGIDGLEWDKVKAELQSVFEEDEVDITVYNYVP